MERGHPPTRELRSALPGERPHVTRRDVAASQRSRLLDAVTQSVADKGYPATTVADIVAVAGVSRTTFYEHFKSKLECFLEAYQSGFDATLERMDTEAARHGEGWNQRLRLSVRSMLATLAESPDFARTFFVEVMAAGPEALDHRAQIMRRFADALAGTGQRARSQRPGALQIPQHTLDALVGGVTELIAVHVRAGRTDELPALESVVMHFILAVLLGNEEAAEALRQPGEGTRTA